MIGIGEVKIHPGHGAEVPLLRHTRAYKGIKCGFSRLQMAAVCFTGVSVSGLFTLVLLSRFSGMGRRSRTFASFSREDVPAMHAVSLIFILLGTFMTLY